MDFSVELKKTLIKNTDRWYMIIHHRRIKDIFSKIFAIFIPDLRFFEQIYALYTHVPYRLLQVTEAIFYKIPAVT